MSVVELTRDLVAIPSHEDETSAGDYIEAWLREETDARVERDSVGNVIARYGDSDTVALVGHHDVVAPDASQVSDGEYVVYEENDRLFGRGTADMKGAVAAMLLAFRDVEPQAGVMFASFVGEETGGRGARRAIADGFAPEYAVIGEGSTNYSGEGVLDVAVAHKGRRASTITAVGSAAHASEPDAGTNAVYRACDAINYVRSVAVPTVTVFGESLAGSVVVTQVNGGNAWNVIPETCTVTIDERTVPGERAPIDAVEIFDGVNWEVDQDLPPMRCDNSEFADLVLACVRDVSGAGEHVTKPHATDAGWLADHGVSCVVCGPAEPGEAHTAHESVSIPVLTQCYETYQLLGSSIAEDGL